MMSGGFRRVVGRAASALEVKDNIINSAVSTRTMKCSSLNGQTIREYTKTMDWRRISAAFVIMGVIVCELRAQSGEVLFKNGDRVSGIITRSENTVTIEKSVFGTVTASADEV